MYNILFGFARESNHNPINQIMVGMNKDIDILTVELAFIALT